MGAFHTSCLVENFANRSRRARAARVLVDTGSEHTWLPESLLRSVGISQEKKDLSFMMANGQLVTDR